jgi:hypothetical protein
MTQETKKAVCYFCKGYCGRGAHREWPAVSAERSWRVRGDLPRPAHRYEALGIHVPSDRVHFH